MNIREKSEMIYRMIFVKAWAENLGIRSQATRELRIQAEKLTRLCWRWDLEFLDRFDSVKRARRMQTRNDRQINPLYQQILALVESVAQEDSLRKVGAAPTRSQVREQIYGTGGLLPKAEAYGQQHAIK